MKNLILCVVMAKDNQRDLLRNIFHTWKLSLVDSQRWITKDWTTDWHHWWQIDINDVNKLIYRQRFQFQLTTKMVQETHTKRKWDICIYINFLHVSKSIHVAGIIVEKNTKVTFKSIYKIICFITTMNVRKSLHAT